jgi:palmitoyltransferase ZDHHC3/7/25
MNNWIGAKNMKLFLLFLAYAFIGTSATLIIIAATLGHWLADTWGVFKSQARLVLIGATVLFWLLFFAFSLVMFWSQFDAILKDTSTIDKLKGNNFHSKKSKSRLIEEVFGGKLSIWWFLPTKINVDLSLESQY